MAEKQESDKITEEVKAKKSEKLVVKLEEPSSCPMSMLFYVVGFFIVLNYGVYVYDKDAFISYSKQFTALEPLVSFFETVEKFSPFMEFLEDDNWAIKEKEKIIKEKEEIPKEPSDKVFTKEELLKYDGSEGSPGIYLAILGQVFDVSKAPNFYGPNGGYGFFAGKKFIKYLDFKNSEI